MANNNGLNYETTGGKNLVSYRIDPTIAGDINSPAYRNQCYDEMRENWEIVGDVYAGTLRMRKKAHAYLPQFPLEGTDAYRHRVKVATLMNAYARTVDAMVGLVVGSGIKVSGIPESLEKQLKNIDNAGTTFEVFARDRLRDAFDGHSVIVVDCSRPDNPVDNHADAMKAEIRPYWKGYRAEEIINWKTTSINGEITLKQIVFCEQTMEEEGDYGERPVTRYRRWFLQMQEDGSYKAAWEVYEERDEEVSGTDQLKTVYVRVDSATTHLKRIPCVSVYGNKTGYLESIPPLLDLALKNIEHFQIDSDYKKGLSLAGIAIPVVTSDAAEEELRKAFGWDIVMALGKEDGFEWKEANGNALPNKVVALSNIKLEMGVLGLSLIAERGDANITATERLLDSVQQSNQLMAIQASLLQALRQAIEFHAEWMAPTGSGKEKIDTEKLKVALGLDWTELVRSADHMQLLLEFHKEGALSAETLLVAAQQYRVLPGFIDPLAEIEKIAKEQETKAQRTQMIADKYGVSVDGAGKSTSDQTQKPEGIDAAGGGVADVQMRTGKFDKAEKDKQLVNVKTSLDKKSKD
jgi:hypothetical protein